jgi:hypothetical protein
MIRLGSVVLAMFLVWLVELGSKRDSWQVSSSLHVLELVTQIYDAKMNFGRQLILRNRCQTTIVGRLTHFISERVRALSSSDTGSPKV